MSLEFEKPTPHDEAVTMNVLLYGPAKSGKSMGAGSAPGKVLYVSADPSSALTLVHDTYGDRIHEVRVRGVDTLVAVMTELREHPGEWGTVVLDTVGETYRIVLESLTNHDLRPPLPARGDTTVYVERFCRDLCEQPVNVVLIAQEMIIQDGLTETTEWLPATGTTGKGGIAFAKRLLSMVDVIGYTGRIEAPEDRDEEEMFVAQLVLGKGRNGGDRFGALGQVRETDLSEWLTAIAAARELRHQQREPAPEPAAA